MFWHFRLVNNYDKKSPPPPKNNHTTLNTQEEMWFIPNCTT